MAQIGVLSTPLPGRKSSTTLISTIEVPTPPTSPPPPTPRTISELIFIRSQTAHDQPILGYPSQGVDYVEYTFGQLHQFTNRGATVLASQLPLRASSSVKETVVALLGSSTLDYFVTALALSRLGFTVLFLSTRLSEAAYVSLLKATACVNICSDAAFQKVITGVQSQVTDLAVLNVLSRSQYDVDGGEDVESNAQASQRLDLNDESQRIAWIIHSSGSTGLPKPIYQTHSAALKNYEHNMNMEGFITLPLFHAHGLSSVLRGFSSYKKIFMYNASIPLTSQSLLAITRKYNFEIFYGVPYALKLLSESDEGIRMLTKMKVVMFGGSACPDGLGDLLVERGVNLISHYGTTETGQLMTSFRPVGDKAWNYVRVHDRLEPFVRFEPRGGSLFELIVLDGWPSKVASNRDNGSYATKDLFEPHENINGAWKYSGRLDDTIVLMNGEKAIPLSMEMAVRQQSLVQDAVVFGTAKARLGMAVIKSDAATDLEANEFIERIWHAVEQENQNAPSYAHISREAIIILAAGTTYPQTDKGTLIRQAFYKTFSAQIDQLYERLEAASNGTLVLNEAQMRQYLREQIIHICPNLDAQDIADESDLFSLGIDSLQSSRLRGKILQDIQLNGNTLSQNMVFEYPSVAKLAASVIATREGVTADVEDVEKEMNRLITKYSVFPSHKPMPSRSKHRIVVVTGATGSLGAHIVAQLAVRTDLTEVCCLVRAASAQTALRRTLRSMNERAVLHSLPLSARRKITAYPSDFARSDLGLSETLYHHLTSGVFSVIHCAWSVNFNKRLSSFEADCIAGAKNLMQLCLAAEQPKPASFNFCSSVSTVARTPGAVVPESLPESLACAQGMGYAQSKLVTEHVIARAAHQTGISARVLRVGQIVADTTHGIWNNTEAIPLMLQAATTIGALPILDENPRWLPVDVVATSINDIALSEQTGCFFNVVNPNAFHWTRDLLPSLEQAGLSFERVSQKDWVQKLRESNPDVVVNPTFKLLEFFASKYDHDRPAKAGLRYDTQCVEAVSPIISQCPDLTQDLVNKFVKNFLATSWKRAVTSGPDAVPCVPRAWSSSIQKSNTTLIVLSGPCGSGKSTIATNLAHALSAPPRTTDQPHPTTITIEGDSLHDAIALTKMTNGIALSPLDREIWLSRVKITILERLRATELFNRSVGVAAINTHNDKIDEEKTQHSTTFASPRTYIILTCSALQATHRAALRSIGTSTGITTQFVMLEASEDELVRRVDGRRGHYMKSCMVRGQLEAMEKPGVMERDVLPVDTDFGVRARRSGVDAGADAAAEGTDGIVGEICDVLGYV